MKHFVITRFNVSFKGIYDHDKNKNEINSLTWLRKRFELFDKYCFPSVIGQSNQDFIWLVFFGNDTPIEFHNKINGYSLLMPNFYSVFVDDDKHFKSEILVQINNMLNTTDEYIITTRLDNDDVFSKDYIDKIQKVFKPKHDLYIDFYHGAQFHERNKVLLRFLQKKSHFISKIERVNDIKTVMCSNHMQIENFGVVESHYTENPMWVELIHDTNLVNVLSKNTEVLNRNCVNISVDFQFSKVNMIKQRLVLLTFRIVENVKEILRPIYHKFKRKSFLY